MRAMQSNNLGRAVATDETDCLISKAVATAVHNRRGQHRGSVHNLMIDNRAVAN
jgi:hypothetical protein